MSHASAWQRDDMRLRDLLPRVATLPLGSGALAGNPFLVDRQFIAEELGMIGGVCPNSMDAVSDRKYAANLLLRLGMLCCFEHIQAQLLATISERDWR